MGLTSRRIDESQKRVTSDMNLNYLHVCFNKRISTPQQLRSVRSDRQQHRDEAEAMRQSRRAVFVTSAPA